MSDIVKVDRVKVKGDLMSGELDVRFAINEHGHRKVIFGGESRVDEDNVVRVNNVGYVVSGLAVTELNAGWMPAHGSRALTRQDGDLHRDPTSSARMKLWDWANKHAPRLAEQHADRWPEAWRSPTKNMAARRRELEAQLRHLRQYEMMWFVLNEADRHRVVPFQQAVTCSWRNGFMGHNAHTDHTGTAFGWVEVERGGVWVRLGVAVAENSHATRFSPQPIELVRFRYEPETAEVTS